MIILTRRSESPTDHPSIILPPALIPAGATQGNSQGSHNIWRRVPISSAIRYFQLPTEMPEVPNVYLPSWPLGTPFCFFSPFLL